jgi:hypothetical protein
MGAAFRRTTARRRRGMALFDALIGGVLLGTGLAVVLSITSRSLTMQTKGEARLTAAWLADELLAMVVVEGPDVYGRRHDLTARFAPPFETFTYEVTIEHLGRGAPYRVNAFVRWSERPVDSVQVETLIALRGGDDEPLREPLEFVDRFERYYDDEEGF